MPTQRARGHGTRLLAAVGVICLLPGLAQAGPLGVVPILIGPLQVLLAILPAILVAIGGMLLALFKPSVIKAGIKLLWKNKLPATIVAGAVVGVVYLLSYAFAAAGPKASKAVGGGEWPAFRGGAGRRGAVPGSGEPTAGAAVWNFAREAKTFYSSPAVVGNRVYVSSAEKGVFKDSGAIYCLDADNGGVVWKYAPRGFRATFSSPAVADGYVVSGEGLHFTRDARVTCLKAETGELVWEYRTASHVESSPCIYGGKAYIGAGDDGLYCIALEPAPDGQPRVIWHLDGKEYPDCETAPIAHEGKVYFGLGQGGSAVVCVDAATGRKIWRVRAPYPVFGSPAVADGKLFVGMGNGNFIETAEQIRDRAVRELREGGGDPAEIAQLEKRLAPGGEVWAMDLDTGRRLWKYQLKRTILGTIAAADGRLYFGSRDGLFHCLGTDGKLIRQWDAHDAIVTSPAVGSEHVYLVTESGRLYGLDRRTLRPVWEAVLGTGGPFLSSPTLARGHVYVGTTQDGLLCLGEPAGGKREALWAGRLGGPGRSGRADANPLPARGRFAWRYPKDDADAEAAPPASPKIHAPVAYCEGALYLGLDGADRRGLLKLALNDDRAKPPTERWFHPTLNAPQLSAAAGGGRVYFVDGRPGQAGRKLRCLDADTGRALWKSKVADQATGEMLLTSERLYVFDGAEALSCFRLTGERGLPAYRTGRQTQPGASGASRPGRAVWSQAVGRPVGPPALAEGIVLVATASPPQVLALSSVNGGRLWRDGLPSAPTTGPVSSGELVAVGTAQGLVAVSIVDGSRAWSVDCGAVEGWIVSDDDRLACVTASSQLVVLDWKGREVYRLKNPRPLMPPMLFDEKLLYVSTDTIETAELKNANSRQWLKTRWLGQLTAPPVLIEGYLYFPTTGKGLVCARPR